MKLIIKIVSIILVFLFPIGNNFELNNFDSTSGSNENQVDLLSLRQYNSKGGIFLHYLRVDLERINTS
ncbi:MAG: hypothetical protein ACW967_06810 [Candidatus Hodarchaeales archaeon]